MLKAVAKLMYWIVGCFLMTKSRKRWNMRT